jgi:PAS domain S-box-containing protein
MQSVIVSLPNEAIIPFVVSGLSDVPGVKDIKFEAEKRIECGGLFCFPIATDSFFYGALAVDVVDIDIDIFLPYVDYVRNFCFMVAVILDERRQRRLNEENLERQVAERTCQLSIEIAAHENTEQLLRNIIDTSPDMIFAKDQDLLTVLCNKKFAQALSKLPEEVIGHTDIENGWSPDFVKGFEHDDRKALSGEVVHNLHDPANINGKTRIFDTYKVPLRDHEGGIIGLLGISRDVTERIEAEKRNAIVIRTSPIAIAIARVSDGCFVEANDAFIRLLGRTREDLIGRTSVEIGYWPDADSRRKWLEALNREGELYGFEVMLCDANGGLRNILMSSSFIDFADAPCVINFIHDITERNKTEEALRQSNAELESFAYISSHDLREPLRNVTTFSTLLGRRLEGRLNDDEKEFLQIIYDGAMRMDSLIRDILDFSRVGRLFDPVATADLADVLKIVLVNMRGQIDETGAEVIVGTPLPSLRGSRNELESLFQNLIANAMKYRIPDIAPKIFISCERKDQIWQFHFRDNGIGLEPGMEYETRIFRLFQRLHQRNEYGGGTGVGLAICKKVVERHGGQIWVESPGVNQGTSFFFTLPA